MTQLISVYEFIACDTSQTISLRRCHSGTYTNCIRISFYVSLQSLSCQTDHFLWVDCTPKPWRHSSIWLWVHSVICHLMRKALGSSVHGVGWLFIARNWSCQPCAIPSCLSRGLACVPASILSDGKWTKPTSSWSHENLMNTIDELVDLITTLWWGWSKSLINKRMCCSFYLYLPIT